MEIQVKPKVFQYDVKVRWSADKYGVLTAAGKPDLEVASPPEFRGHPGIWTPEQLFVAAVSSCAMLTFLSSATRREVRLISYDAEATGTLENAGGTFRFTKAILRPRVVVRGEDDIEKARAALLEAEAGCLIANSIQTKVESQSEIAVLTPVEAQAEAAVRA